MKLNKMNVCHVAWITTCIIIYYNDNTCIFYDLLASSIHVTYRACC